jgi:hypothetical protein
MIVPVSMSSVPVPAEVAVRRCAEGMSARDVSELRLRLRRPALANLTRWTEGHIAAGGARPRASGCVSGVPWNEIRERYRDHRRRNGLDAKRGSHGTVGDPPVVASTQVWCSQRHNSPVRVRLVTRPVRDRCELSSRGADQRRCAPL